ncbi:MAG TPA: MBL fold metallo-hydrolase [Patescibacteria group bacterium]
MVKSAFWERTIDLALLTHPHADHFTGYYFVAERYNIVGFATENLSNKTEGFKLLLDTLQKKKI